MNLIEMAYMGLSELNLALKVVAGRQLTDRQMKFAQVLELNDPRIFNNKGLIKVRGQYRLTRRKPQRVGEVELQKTWLGIPPQRITRRIYDKEGRLEERVTENELTGYFSITEFDPPGRWFGEKQIYDDER